MDAQLYYDAMSQPSRACVLFCRANQLQKHGLKEVLTQIHKGATRTPEYRALNPTGKVPFLQAGSLRLPESGAILTYLASTFPGGQDWLPADPVSAAPINAAMHWFHTNIRAGSAQLIFNLGAIPLGQEVDLPLAAKALNVLKASLSFMESHWLASSPYLAGRHSPSIADLQYSCELEQLVLLEKGKHGTTMQEVLQPYPKVREWMRAVAAATAPHYDEVHAIIRKVAALRGNPPPAQMSSKM